MIHLSEYIYIYIDNFADVKMVINGQYLSKLKNVQYGFYSNIKISIILPTFNNIYITEQHLVVSSVIMLQKVKANK